MRVVALQRETDWDGWRAAARALVLADVPPETLAWIVDAAPSQPAVPHVPPGVPPGAPGFAVPRALVALAAQAIQARDPERFALLYRLVWRVHAGAPVLEDAGHPDLQRARALALAVRAEAHRMRALLRYLPTADGTRFVGWYAPAHFVLEANAQLLARWYSGFAVSILTPDGSAHWDAAPGDAAKGDAATGDAAGVAFGPAVDPAAVPDDAALAAYWTAFGADLRAAAIAGTSLPEAASFEEARRPPDRPPLGRVVPGGYGATDPALAAAAREAAACRRCPLGAPATQTVFGEGPAGARVMFVGEQAGDHEDVIGRPFVGPAGQVLDRALEAAGIDRRAVWISNAVKHFKFVERGRRRLHQTPLGPEIAACGFWLEVERARLRPALIVLLGATAARTVLGRPVTIGRERGRPIRLPTGETALVTVHPSFLLRVPDAAAQAREYAAFVADLRLAAGLADAAAGT